MRLSPAEWLLPAGCDYGHGLPNPVALQNALQKAGTGWAWNVRSTGAPTNW